MNIRISKYILGAILGLVVISMGVLSFSSTAQSMPQATGITLTPTPGAPTPDPIHPQTEIALAYLNEKYGVSTDQMVVMNQYQQDYVYLKKSYWFVTVLETKDDTLYKVQVDLNDKNVSEDLLSIEQAEQTAKRDKYGKLESALYERLQSMKSDEKIEVAIWVAGEPVRSEPDLYALLAAKYPEVQDALEKSGNPFDVGDYDLMMEIKREYLGMMADDNHELVLPAIEHLKSLGYEVIISEGMPTVFVTLPKSIILTLAPEPWVGGIFLADQVEEQETDSAIPSDRVPVVWGRGFDGSGVDIAILEIGKIDFTDDVDPTNYLNKGLVRSCSLGTRSHKTRVASVAGSYHPIYTGVAKGAPIHDACTSGTTGDTINALSWATNYASIINYSATVGNVDGLQYLDRAFDHYARHNNVFITKSAGNSGSYITSPGYGWNVMTVGATKNKETSSWSDDEMWNSSNWRNHSSSNVEKPEVVAPGYTIKTIDQNGNEEEFSGTSYSAPQVAGVAALMVDRNINLAAWPTAIKAIIMASAVNNIEGPRVIESGQDLKDGAGAIDAALADQVAKTRWTSSTSPCPGSCWWGETFSSSSLPAGHSLYRYFKASKGERVRVNIAWWSNVYCPNENNCYDSLATDLDLAIYDPNGSSIGWGASYHNNYEIFEFTAPKTGNYKIRVYNYSSYESSNDLGIAVSKEATYLPDIRFSSGWVSQISILNTGAEPQDVYVTFSNGAQTIWWGLPPNRVWRFPVSQIVPSNFIGSAIVNAEEGVSVAIENQHSSKVETYVGIPGNPSVSGIGVDDSVYIPAYYRNYYGWSSTIYAQNTGTAQTTVHAYFYNDSGSQVNHNTYTVYANKQQAISLSGTTMGSVRITAGQPLAVVVSHNHSLMSFSYVGVSEQGAKGYLPALFKNYYGWMSSYQVQEVKGSSVNVSATYYPSGSKPPFSLSSRGHREVYMGSEGVSNGWHGAGMAYVSSGSGKVATAIHHTNTNVNGALGYHGFQAGARSLALPYVNKDASWSASITVQNVGTTNTDVTLKFFDTNGLIG